MHHTNLESRIVEFTITKLLKSVTDFPFVDALGAFEKLVQVLTNIKLRSAVFEEPVVEWLF